MNAAQALLHQVLRELTANSRLHWLSDDLEDAIREELERADATPPDRPKTGPRILPLTAYRAGRFGPVHDDVEPDSPRGRYTYPPPDPRLRGLRFDAEEG
jgi:hypothetical protein